MHDRPLGRHGFNGSEISFGAWAFGGAWGAQAGRALRSWQRPDFV
jgi:aryl-alcohol dehydrogenase-like predicted oxidoreductase